MHLKPNTVTEGQESIGKPWPRPETDLVSECRENVSSENAREKESVSNLHPQVV